MKNNKWVLYSIWMTWFTLVVVWNYFFPNVMWWEDVFATVCMAAFNRSLMRNLG